MGFGVLGINHLLAPVALRGAIAEIANRRLHHDRSIHGDQSLILLSTCNRIEIYFSSPTLSWTHSYLLEILKRECPLPFDQLLYTFFGKACLRHLMRVTSGLDSALMGETEIQGQVKRAYLESSEIRQLPFELHFLFQKSLHVGKKIRNRHLKRGAEASLESGVEIILEKHLKPGTPLLLVGASETNHRIALHLRKRGKYPFSLSNRTASKGDQLAMSLGCPFIPWKAWQEAQGIVFATSSPTTLLDPEDTFLFDGKKRLLIDLGVPQNVDPRLRANPGVTLFDIDEIQKAARNGTGRKERSNIELEISQETELLFDQFIKRKKLAELSLASPDRILQKLI